MELHGHHIIAGEPRRQNPGSFAGIDPDSGATLAPQYADATHEEIDTALGAARVAFVALRRRTRDDRAALLEAIADGLMALGDPLLERAGAETGLPRARLEMERGRTCNQLRMFAALVREGSFVAARIDTAQPDRVPIPKPDLRRMLIPLGPVVVFGASNFPLAFSVAGGDTASALAAGCPVVAKAHPHHPGTSEMVARAVADAVAAADFPAGTFSLLHGVAHEVGKGLVTHPATRAVGFTGSLAGGRALFDAAAARPEPIPVYAEMGSTNPVFVLPGALAERAAALAEGMAQSVTLGVGQFCTNPGLVFAVDGDAAQRFVTELGSRIEAAPTGVTLHAGIAAAYAEKVDALAGLPDVKRVGRDEDEAPCRATPAILVATAAAFENHAALRDEVFGPCTVVVLCPSTEALCALAQGLPGQLTATVHGTDADLEDCDGLLATLEDRVGRLLFGGFPTGVEVCPSMHHGGPYPATTDAATTSVGSAAVQRFLRPLCYQSCPPARLPRELQDGNPAGILRLVDGVWSRE